MRMIISGRHLEITDAIREYAEKKVGKIKKYFEHILEVDVTLSVEHSKTEGDKHVADVLIFANGTKIKAQAVDSILYAAIDEVVDVLEQQLKKYKEKLKNRQHHKELPADMFEQIVYEEDLKGDRKLIKGKLCSAKPMSIDEAILQMESLGQNFYTFMNFETEELNVIYKRKDGDYGHIEPAWSK